MKTSHKSNIAYILVGPPASGKSTWSDERIRLNPSTVLIASDTVRKELLGDEENFTNEPMVWNTIKERWVDSLKNGNTTILDATNVVPRNREFFVQSAKKIGCVVIAVDTFAGLPVEVMLERNAKRKRVVPEHVIRNMFKSYVPPTEAEGFDSVITPNK